MKLTITSRIHRSIVCIATAIAVAAPGLARAELGARVKARVEMIKTNGGTLISNVRGNAQDRFEDVRERIGDEHQPLLDAIEGARGSGAEIFEEIKRMRVLEQLRQTAAMIRQMQTDYEHFSGGEGCGGTCAGFRSSLKAIVDSFVALALEVPALSNARGLVENLQRMSRLIDYVPPRALYLMWQTMSGQIAELELIAEEIRHALASLPPLTAPSSVSASAVGASADSRSTASAGGSGGGGFCDWANQEKKPVIDLVQAHLERLGWGLEKIADLIPDVEVKGEGGASAGAAVANGTASAGVGVKPTDAPKTLLKAIALIPQELNWVIKLNILRAKVVCSKP
jgi:hypothetical protein